MAIKTSDKLINTNIVLVVVLDTFEVVIAKNFFEGFESFSDERRAKDFTLWS